AKLLVRYVLERSVVDSEVESRIQQSFTQSVINNEVEILTSWDLAKAVAHAIGPERILPGSKEPENVDKAARLIMNAMSIDTGKETNVMRIAYRNSDPKLAVDVLKELVNRYFDMHLEIHRSAGASEFVSAHAEEARLQMQKTADELNKLQAE